ncbi:uncharacterized protein LOC130945077 [Arachis stenosperma]|uniref:uncharacterized protein LOC130945077 n=1 Tax=Arachis stenosperma TaxID=217475 RepID=UPI0025AC905D|nr:uncharacterized protein LOC130945077 [Arachis stenosperma]
MERRFNRESKGGVSLQKRMIETRRKAEPAPDLTDFMNDMFFGAADIYKKNYDFTGGSSVVLDDEDDVGFDDSTRSNSARLTQEWLQEARRIVSSSPTRSDSPARRCLSGSPRFASPSNNNSQPGASLIPSLDPTRDNNLSRTRSARRLRGGEGVSNEILTKSAKHSRNKSDTFTNHSWEEDGSPAAEVRRWFSNILKPTQNSACPPRQHLQRRSRFQTEPSSPAPQPQGIQSPSRPTFKSTPAESLPLSPPRNLVESAHRRTISSSTCSLEKIASRYVAKGDEVSQQEDDNYSLNGFLKEQRDLFKKISSGEIHANAKVILSGPSNSTASMVAAICHAWLLGYREREKGSGVVVPVMNVKRSSMLKLRQAAWLFHHSGLDASALLFADEVDMENLLVTGQVTVLVVGKDILTTTGEVGSQCTILTDNYCEDAYDLLQNSVLKKLLLAGILLDTQNLKASASVSMTRDAEAVQLLLVRSPPNYRYALFDQLLQDQKSTSFVEALNFNYGKPYDQSGKNSEGNMEHKFRERKSSSKSISDRETMLSSTKTNSSDTKSVKSNMVSPRTAKLITPPSRSPAPVSAPAPARVEKESNFRGKNTSFLARWFGFGK